MLNARYSEIRDLEVGILRQHLDSPIVTAAIQETIQKVVNGDLPHCFDALVAMLVKSPLPKVGGESGPCFGEDPEDAMGVQFFGCR